MQLRAKEQVFFLFFYTSPIYYFTVIIHNMQPANLFNIMIFKAEGAKDRRYAGPEGVA